VYLDFYGLKEPPFNITPNPRYLFYSAKHREALNYLLYGIRERKGFVQITGEVGAGKTVVIDDFRSAEIYSGGRCRKLKLPGKGHSEEVDLFIRSIREGLPSPISFESLHYTSLTTFRILDALHTGLPQAVAPA